SPPPSAKKSSASPNKTPSPPANSASSTPASAIFTPTPPSQRARNSASHRAKSISSAITAKRSSIKGSQCLILPHALLLLFKPAKPPSPPPPPAPPQSPTSAPPIWPSAATAPLLCLLPTTLSTVIPNSDASLSTSAASPTSPSFRQTQSHHKSSPSISAPATC